MYSKYKELQGNIQHRIQYNKHTLRCYVQVQHNQTHKHSFPSQSDQSKNNLTTIQTILKLQYKTIYGQGQLQGWGKAVSQPGAADFRRQFLDYEMILIQGRISKMSVDKRWSQYPFLSLNIVILLKCRWSTRAVHTSVGSRFLWQTLSRGQLNEIEIKHNTVQWVQLIICQWSIPIHLTARDVNITTPTIEIVISFKSIIDYISNTCSITGKFDSLLLYPFHKCNRGLTCCLQIISQRKKFIPV